MKLTHFRKQDRLSQFKMLKNYPVSKNHKNYLKIKSILQIHQLEINNKH